MAQYSSKLAPRGPQEAPKRPPRGPQRPPRGPKMAQVGPKMAQVGPKMAPSWPQEAPRWSKLDARWPKLAPMCPKWAPRWAAGNPGPDDDFFFGKLMASAASDGFHGLMQIWCEAGYVSWPEAEIMIQNLYTRHKGYG